MNLKLILGVIVFLIVAIGGVAGFYLSQQSQEIRQQASVDPNYGWNGSCFTQVPPGAQVNLYKCDAGHQGPCNIGGTDVTSNPCFDATHCGVQQIDLTSTPGDYNEGACRDPKTFCDENPNNSTCVRNTGCENGEADCTFAFCDFNATRSTDNSGSCQSEEPPQTNTCVSPNQCVTQGGATASVACGLSGMEPGGSGSCSDGQICCKPSTYVPQCPWDSSGVGSSCIGDGTFAPQGTCEGGSNNGGNCTLDSHCGGGGRCVGFTPCCPGLTGLPDGVCKCPSGSPPPQPSPTPPAQSACGGTCQTTADCKAAATGVAVVCRNNTCQNLTCPEGQTIPGANCSCGVADRTCGQPCGHAFGLCDGVNGTGSICTFTSGVSCTAESQQTYCIGYTNWQVSNPAYTTNFCGNTGQGNSYLIRTADNKTSGFTQEEINSTCAFCGDGILHIGEECDEGANNGSDTSTCDTSCKRKDIVTYACDATCTTDAQCQTSDPSFVCDPSARRCRLANNPTSNTCTPLEAAACLNMTLQVNGQEVAFGSEDPVRGDIIQLVCAQAPRAARYVFRITEPNGQLVILQSQSSTNVSEPYNVTKAGAFKAQCQICTGAANSTCLPFE